MLCIISFAVCVILSSCVGLYLGLHSNGFYSISWRPRRGSQSPRVHPGWQHRSPSLRKPVPQVWDSGAKVSKRKLTHDTPQAKASNRKFPSGVPHTNSSSEICQANKSKFSTKSCQAKVPKRKFPSGGSQTKLSKPWLQCESFLANDPTQKIPGQRC